MAMESALSLPFSRATAGPRWSILPFSPVPSSRSPSCSLSFGLRSPHIYKLLGGSTLQSSPSAAPLRSRSAFVMPSPGGGGGGNDFDGAATGGGGDGGSGDQETETKPAAVDSEDDPPLDADAIVLHVGGMSCGGCAASVKRILESLNSVSAATVNLEKETAFIWVVAEAKVGQDWQKMLATMLANHLTTCGFSSNPKDINSGNIAA